MTEDITKQLAFNTSGAGLESLIQPVQLIQEDRNEEKEKYYSVPSGLATKIGILAIGTSGEESKIDTLKNRIPSFSHGAKIKSGKVESFEGEEMLGIAYERGDDSVRIEFPRHNGTKQAVRKLYNLAMTKANEQCLSWGKIFDPNQTMIRFPLKELVDNGMYKTERSAREGFLKGVDILTKIRIKIDSSTSYGTGIVVPFSTGKIKNGICYIRMNPDAPWPAYMGYYTKLPKYAYALSTGTFDLLLQIVILARQHKDDIAKNGFFTISLKAVATYLQLPDPEGDSNASRKVKGRLLDAIDEINASHQKYAGDNEISLEVREDPDQSATVKDFIENGKLKVYAKGSFANYFNRIEASEEEKIRKKSSKKKKSV